MAAIGHGPQAQTQTYKQRCIAEWENVTYPGGNLLALLRRPSHWKRTFVTRRPAAMEPVAGFTPLHMNGKTRTSRWVNIRVTPKSITYKELKIDAGRKRIRTGKWPCQRTRYTRGCPASLICAGTNHRHGNLLREKPACRRVKQKKMQSNVRVECQTQSFGIAEEARWIAPPSPPRPAQSS